MRTSLVIPIMIAFVSAPAGGALVYYQVTQDPSARPLGVTREQLIATRADGYEAAVTAVISLGPMRANDRRAERVRLSRQLKRTFAAFGIPAQVEFGQIGDGRTGIMFNIGSSRIGPYPVRRAGTGVRAAVDAYHMAQAD